VRSVDVGPVVKLDHLVVVGPPRLQHKFQRELVSQGLTLAQNVDLQQMSNMVRSKVRNASLEGSHVIRFLQLQLFTEEFLQVQHRDVPRGSEVGFLQSLDL